MKYLVILILTLFSLVVKGQYHIKVECYGDYDNINNEQYYHIAYTANDWINNDEIHNSDEITQYATNAIDDYRSYIDAGFTPLISTDKDKLIRLARKFKTLELAKKYNDSVLNRYRNMHAYFMKIKPKFKQLYHLPIKKHCCTVTQIY